MWGSYHREKAQSEPGWPVLTRTERKADADPPVNRKARLFPNAVCSTRASGAPPIMDPLPWGLTTPISPPSAARSAFPSLVRAGEPMLRYSRLQRSSRCSGLGAFPSSDVPRGSTRMSTLVGRTRRTCHSARREHRYTYASLHPTSRIRLVGKGKGIKGSQHYNVKPGSQHLEFDTQPA